MCTIVHPNVFNMHESKKIKRARQNEICWGRNKKSRKKIKLQTNSIVLPRPKYTKPRARRVDLESSPVRDCGKISMLKQRRKKNKQKSKKKTSWTIQPGLINKNQALSEADLKNSYLILISISFHKKMLLICFMTTIAWS